MIENGLYEPNQPGTMEPLWLDGKHVTASVYAHEGEQWVTVFLGLEIAHQGPLSGLVNQDRMLYAWITTAALEYIAGQEQATEALAGEVEQAARQARSQARSEAIKARRASIPAKAGKVTILPPTPQWNTLAPKAKGRSRQVQPVVGERYSSINSRIQL